MQWTDEGIVLGVKRHGETSVILELMTLERGRHLGLVRGGGNSTRLRGVLQPGNSLRATWRARLDEHLGNYVVEGLNLRAAGYLSAAHAVHGVTHLAALCRLLAEREPHAAIYGTLDAILDQFDDPLIAAAVDRALRARLSRRAWFRSRSEFLRRHRNNHRSDLCVAALGPRRVTRRRRRLPRQAPGPAGIPA